jgi:hypothetical protein
VCGAKELDFECAALEVWSAFVAQCTDDAALNEAMASSAIAHDTAALMVTPPAPV